MCLKLLLSIIFNSSRQSATQSQRPCNSGLGNMQPFGAGSNQPFQTPQRYNSQPYPYQQQEIVPSIAQPPSYLYSHSAVPQTAPSPQPNYSHSVSSEPFAWANLILTPSNQPSPLFTRLLDAIFSCFLDGPHQNGLDPIRYASAFTALMYTDNENKPRYFFIFATQNHFPSPEGFVYDVMPIYYRCFNIRYTIENGLPVLTREGFHAVMLRDTLGDPDTQCRRLNAFLATHGARVLDPATGRPFPTLVIPRSAFPLSSDPGTWQSAKQMNEAFNKELSVYLKDMRTMAQQLHGVTMNAI